MSKIHETRENSDDKYMSERFMLMKKNTLGVVNTSCSSLKNARNSLNSRNVAHA